MTLWTLALFAGWFVVVTLLCCVFAIATYRLAESLYEWATDA